MIGRSFSNSNLAKGLRVDTILTLSNFASGIGGSLSSIVFGLILGAGVSFGMSVFAGICIVFVLLSFLLLRKN